MKILYAIQTTGNGHLARAQNIIPKIIITEKGNILFFMIFFVKS